MTVDLVEILPIILYFVLIVFVITLIILTIRLMKTLAKVDQVIDDVNSKMERVDGVFDLVDKMTDGAANFTDKMISGVTNAINFIFRRNKKKGRDEDE